MMWIVTWPGTNAHAIVHGWRRSVAYAISTPRPSGLKPRVVSDTTWLREQTR